jgi:hypothetical protein
VSYDSGMTVPLGPPSDTFGTQKDEHHLAHDDLGEKDGSRSYQIRMNMYRRQALLSAPHGMKQHSESRANLTFHGRKDGRHFRKLTAKPDRRRALDFIRTNRRCHVAMGLA